MVSRTALLKVLRIEAIVSARDYRERNEEMMNAADRRAGETLARRAEQIDSLHGMFTFYADLSWDFPSFAAHLAAITTETLEDPALQDLYDEAQGFFGASATDAFMDDVRRIYSPILGDEDLSKCDPFQFDT